jgi:hypothetical protein
MLEAGGARTLRNESFFSAPQLKRDPLGGSGGACDQVDGTDVRTTGLLADVTPYDLLPPPGTVCIAILRASPRSVQFTFAAPGTGVVRLHGRRFGGADVTLQGSVVVRP